MFILLRNEKGSNIFSSVLSQHTLFTQKLFAFKRKDRFSCKHSSTVRSEMSIENSDAGAVYSSTPTAKDGQDNIF
jgi:hypothetical protein